MQQLTADEIPELLARLVDKSLVQLDANGRYDLLQLVRSFAQEELFRSDGGAQARRNHLAYYSHLCGETASLMFGPDEAKVYALVTRESANLRTAIEFATADPDTWVDAVRMLNDTYYAHFVIGSLSEGLVMAEAAVRTAPENSEYLLAGVWASIATYHQRLAHKDTMHSIESAISLGEQSGNPFAIYVGLFQKAIECWRRGNFEEGNILGQRALSLARQDDNKPIEARLLNYLGLAALHENEIEKALDLFERSIAIWSELGHRRGIDVVSSNLGHLHERLGNHVAAYQIALQTLPALYALGDYVNVGGVLVVACSGFWEAQDYETAAQVLGGAFTVWDRSDSIPDEVDRQTAERWRARLLEAMGTERFLAALEKGKHTPTTDLVEKVLSNPEPWMPA